MTSLRDAKAYAQARQAYPSPDGFPRSLDDERELNEAFAAAFAGPAGERALAYLRSITLHAVSGPEHLNALRLAHLEGQRYLMGLIQKRYDDGRAKLPALPETSDE